MVATGPGDSGRDEVDPLAMLDLLDDGRGPERLSRRPVALARIGQMPTLSHVGPRGRFALAVLAVAALVVGTAVVGRQPHQAPVAGPRPAAVVLTPSTHDVQLLLDQYSYTADKDVFSLQLSLVNYGTAAVDVLATRLPQAGARPIPGPGGDRPFAAPITLVPNLSAPISVPVRVTCPGVLTAPLADHIDVTLGRSARPQEVVRLALAPLGSLLDDARHAACGVSSASAAVYPMFVAGSVRAVRTGITSTLRVEDVGDAAASVMVLGAAPASVEVSAVGGPVGRALTITEGTSALVTLRWRILDCVAAEEVRWPTLRLSITVPTSTATNSYGFDSDFGAQWRAALTAACQN